MGIFDLFTGSAGKKAANAQIGQLWGAQDRAMNAIDVGQNVISGSAIPALQSGYGDAIKQLERFYGPASQYAGEATASFNPMIASGQQGVDAYKAALGLGGADATAAFRNTPGYEFARDEGLEAVKRAAAARGDLASGNVTADLLKTATGYADQNYGNYLQRLQPLMQMYGTGIAGRATGLGNQATLATGQGRALADLHSGQGTGIAGLYGNIASMEGNKANILANLGRSIAETTGQGMMAGAQGSANLLSAIMGGLNMVGKVAAAPATGGASMLPFFGK